MRPATGSAHPAANRAGQVALSAATVDHAGAHWELCSLVLYMSVLQRCQLKLALQDLLPESNSVSAGIRFYTQLASAQAHRGGIPIAVLVGNGAIMRPATACRKKQGLLPTGQVKSKAVADGFDNVHDWLVFQATGDSADAIAARKTAAPWLSTLAVPPPSSGTKRPFSAVSSSKPDTGSAKVSCSGSAPAAVPIAQAAKPPTGRKPVKRAKVATKAKPNAPVASPVAAQPAGLVRLQILQLLACSTDVCHHAVLPWSL